MNEIYINIGNNKYTPNQIINFVTEENETKEDIILKKTQNKVVSNVKVKNDIIVEGIEDIKVNIASCCKPICGDEIVGYITKGNGITVHRISCPNISDIQERIIDVRWNESLNKKYPASLLIRSVEGKNILMDIIAKTSNTDITIESIKTISVTEDYLYEITVLVENKEKIDKYMNDLYMISDIKNVERKFL